MIAKRFFYGCGGVLCLALAFHLGRVMAHARGVQIDPTSIAIHLSVILTLGAFVFLGALVLWWCLERLRRRFR